MHHLIQNNMYNEFGFRHLMDAIKDLKLPYGIFKLRPFDHEVEWIEGVITGGAVPTMVWGTVNLERVSKMYGWHPGVFKNENFDMKVLHEKWGPWMLNEDAKFYKLGECPGWEGTAFIRPVLDSKSFTGQLMNGEEFDKWRKDLVALEGDWTTVDLNTEIMISSPKHVIDEARFFVVDRKICTGSMYRVDGRVLYKRIGNDTPLYKPMWDWLKPILHGDRVPGTPARTLVSNVGWLPAEAFVVDVARTEKGFSIIEVNCLNAAGFYDCDMRQVVQALEYLHPWPEQWKRVNDDSYKAQPWEKVLDDREFDEWRMANGYAHVIENRGK